MLSALIIVSLCYIVSLVIVVLQKPPAWASLPPLSRHASLSFWSRPNTPAGAVLQNSTTAKNLRTYLGVILEPSKHSSWSRTPELDDGEESQGGGGLCSHVHLFSQRGTIRALGVNPLFLKQGFRKTPPDGPPYCSKGRSICSKQTLSHCSDLIRVWREKSSNCFETDLVAEAHGIMPSVLVFPLRIAKCSNCLRRIWTLHCYRPSCSFLRSGRDSSPGLASCSNWKPGCQARLLWSLLRLDSADHVGNCRMVPRCSFGTRLR